VNLTRTPGHDRLAASPLDALLSAVLGRRVRGLKVEVRDGGLVLRGRADSFHVKQLAQHAAMAVTELPLGANEIEVAARTPRRVVLASGNDGLRATGRARLTAGGWEVATARDALECLALLRGHTPDVAVLDAGLLWGGADGILAAMARGALPRVPVVMLGHPPQLPVGLTAVAAVLEEPVGADALAAAVAAAAGGPATAEGE